MLDVQQVSENLSTFFNNIEKVDKRHQEKLRIFYEGVEELSTAPASSVKYYHNAFPGGYVDHVNRVVSFSENLYDQWMGSGLDLSDFTREELIFVAINHDLGKLGFIKNVDVPSPAGSYYVVNNDSWSKEKLQKVYNANEDIPFSLVPDLSIYTLQQHGLQLSWNEYQGIKLHDGLYDDSNKPYFIARKEASKLRSKLPYIIHHADHMAALYEYDRYLGKTDVKELKKESVQTTEDLFADIFK